MILPVHIRLSRLAPCVLLGLAASPLGASAADPVLPTAPSVVQGQARIATSGQSMTVTSGRNAVIDWRSFSIGPQAAVRFEQADAASQVLNRVLGRDPSQILGRLSSNGEVWLLNPYGVLFGRDARVDVAGLVASSLNLSTTDWAAGRRRLDQLPGVAASAVSNAGTLRSSTGGRILLVGGGGVVNEGSIESPQGQIGLRAGASVELADSTHPGIAVRVFAPGQGVKNRGVLSAAGGLIDLQGAMVNQAGMVRADGLGQGPGGTVVLRASEALTVEVSSFTSTQGTPGGRIELLGGTQLVSGRLDAGSALGQGGQVSLAGPQVALLDGAAVNVDGARGGGEIALGLAHEANGLSTAAAQAVFVGSQAQLSANALQSGNGGGIRLRSAVATRAYGSFSARGGANGGDGGFIETSGNGLLARPALVDTQAPRGRAGLWLLDPLNVQIVQGDGNGQAGAAPDFSPIGPDATVGTNTITNALTKGDVTISTGTAGSDAGVISMVDTTLQRLNPGSNNFPERTLTLSAASGIVLDRSRIVATGGLLHLRLLAGSGVKDGIRLSGSTIDVTGDLTLRGASFSTETSALFARRIDVQANRVALGAPPSSSDDCCIPSTLSTAAAGNAIVLRGLVGNMDVFSNQAGSSALSTNESGNYLLYASDPANTKLDGLFYRFKQYDAAYPAVPIGHGNGLLYATQPVLGVTAQRLPLNKVYDTSRTLPLTAAQLDKVALTGYLPGDEPSARTGVIADLSYDSRNAGNAVPITATLKGPLPPVLEGDTPVYGYTFAGQGLVGNISRAPIRLAAATVANKVYDGGTSAVATDWSLSGVLRGDSVSVATGTASFLNAQAGANKLVLAQATGLGGADAVNYRLIANDLSGVPFNSATTSTTANITHARLTYRAQTQIVAPGSGWPTLTGTVSGFVASETQEGATSGTLRFTTLATPLSPPGSYAIQGAGLTAANYSLVQDPANAQALLMLPAGDGVVHVSRPKPDPEWPGTQGTGPVVVIEPNFPVGFAPLDESVYSSSQLAAAFQARELAFARPFRASKALLDANPRLADLPSCTSLGGAMQGSCVITPAIKAALRALWNVQPPWQGQAALFDREAQFGFAHWHSDLDISALGSSGRFLLGDGRLASNLPTGMRASETLTAQMLVAPGAAGGQLGAVAPGQRSAGAPPAVIVAGGDKLGDLNALAPTAAGPSPASAEPVCVTPTQQLSGECRRQAELAALREVQRHCAQEPREKQASCLFSQQVKAQLQQREREARLLSLVLRPQEPRQATLHDIRRKWALVIGIDHYPKVVLKDGQAARIPSAGNDARAVAAELRDNFGYITSALVNYSRAEVVQRLNMLAAVAQPNDSLLIFFSGYGFGIGPGDDAAVWALSDADSQDPRSVLSHADLARLLELIDARQAALISDSAMGGRLRAKAVDYNPLVAPDAGGLLDRRATVAMTSGGNLPRAMSKDEGLSEFTAQWLSVLRRVKTWHVGGRVFREVHASMEKDGKVHLPGYGAASNELHQVRADYIFERRVLEREAPSKP